MKYRYIVFYASANGHGNSELILKRSELKRSELPSKIENIRAIEKSLSESIGENISVTGWERTGRSWK